jgi:integrase/recombinase XerD
VSALPAENLTLGDAARIMRDALKDRSYRATPLGLEVARYYRWKKNEWGATEETLRDYEAVLRNLCVYFADLELTDLEPPVGTERIREVWDHYWGDKSARTRAKCLSIYRDFFKWAVREGRMYGDPTIAISRPRIRSTVRSTFSQDNVEKIIAAQPRLRDKIALRLLFHLGLRKGELSRLQFKHFDLPRSRVTIQGKGGKVRQVPIVDEHLRLDIERHILERDPDPQEFLLYPERIGPRNNLQNPQTGKAPMDRLWENRMKGMTSTSMHRWWHRCLENARVEPRPMHEARHTAITELIRHPGANLKHAQLLAGHSTIQTTADIYGHLDDKDLEKVMREMARGRRSDS